MKRILLSVFAAALTAAYVVPADAADVTLSGQYRLRGEYRNDADFNGNVNDHTDSWGQRVRLTADAKATDDTSIKITLQDTRTWGASTNTNGGPALTDTGNTLDFHESYVNINNLFGAPVSLRAGRQQLSYGDGRLVANANWSNNDRSFDALKFTYTSAPVNVDLFTSKVRDSGTTSTDQDFTGIYATVKAIPNNTLDLYVLWLRDGLQSGNNAFGWGTTIGNTAITGGIDSAQSLYTYGARLKGAVAGLDYTLELPLQSGSVDTRTTSYNLKGWAAAAKLGYTLPTPTKVRLGLEYDYASGDNDASNNDIKTFMGVFPSTHDKIGIMDIQAWRNVKALGLTASADVTEKLNIGAGLWNLHLAQKHDAWYADANWDTTPTGLRAASATETNSSIGNELDLTATYKYNSAVTAEVGYSHLFSGKFIKDRINATANSDKQDQDWAYMMLTANF